MKLTISEAETELTEEAAVEVISEDGEGAPEVSLDLGGARFKGRRVEIMRLLIQGETLLSRSNRMES